VLEGEFEDSVVADQSSDDFLLPECGEDVEPVVKSARTSIARVQQEILTSVKSVEEAECFHWHSDSMKHTDAVFRPESPRPADAESGVRKRKRYIMHPPKDAFCRDSCNEQTILSLRGQHPSQTVVLLSLNGYA